MNEDYSNCSLPLANAPIPDTTSLGTNCLIAGIVNATPDSFSDGRQLRSCKEAVCFGNQLLADGANILDIGGEATGPGSIPVNEEEELNRVIPLVKALSSSCALSIDTFKARVAEQALAAGAQIINDVSALRFDNNMAAVIKDFQAQVILMYSKEPGHSPHVSEQDVSYKDVCLEIRQFLEQRIEHAIASGIDESNIIIDPGMGRFIGSDPELSWALLRNLEAIVKMGFPVMIGTSRKGFLGGDVDEREHSSALTSLFASLQGATILRTHNPKLTRETIELWQKFSVLA